MNNTDQPVRQPEAVADKGEMSYTLLNPPNGLLDSPEAQTSNISSQVQQPVETGQATQWQAADEQFSQFLSHAQDDEPFLSDSHPLASSPPVVSTPPTLQSERQDDEVRNISGVDGVDDNWSRQDSHRRRLNSELSGRYFQQGWDPHKPYFANVSHLADSPTHGE